MNYLKRFLQNLQNGEGWLNQLLEHNLLMPLIFFGFNLFYWRHRNEEVDFVLEKRGKVVAIEVKTGADTITSGMEAFTNQFHPDKMLLVGRKGIPWQEFLILNPMSYFKI